MLRMLPAVSCVVVCFLATPALAGTVRVDYAGIITTVSGNPFGLTIPASTPITGYFQYDTATADTSALSTVGNYPHTNGGGAFVAEFLGHTVAGSSTPFVQVTTSSTLRIIDGPRSVGSQGGIMSFNGLQDSGIEMSFATTPNNSALIPDDSLPDPFPIFTFGGPTGDPHTFSLRSGGSFGPVFLVQMQSMTQVPEPGIASLSAIVGVGFVIRHRRRRLC